MYNHYIPQSDGSFRKSAIPEQGRRPVRTQEPRPAPPKEPPEALQPPVQQENPRAVTEPLSFLKKLLPKELDSWDLVIIGFLLLLSGEENEDGLSPLLTIALYFLL